MADRRTLLRGGVLLTSDPDLGVLWPGDILVLDERIAAVGPTLEACDADVIELGGRMVLPGFVDTHRHTWQSIVRNIAADWTLTDYLAGLHAGLSRHYRPQDTYIGNLLGALEALDSGITTLVDFSHNLFTPEHADAAIQALRESRMRAVFAHGGGAKEWGGKRPSDVPHPEDARRIRAQQFASNDDLVTMAIALRGPQFCTEETNRNDFALARDLDLPVNVHIGYGEWGKQGPIRVLERDGLLADTTTYVHCNTLGDDELDIIRDSGGTVAVAPDVEMQMGHGWPATGRLLAHGIWPTFGIDVCSSNGGDMFATMRTAIGVQRALDNSAAVEAMENVDRLRITCRDVLEFATVDGAHAAGLEGVTGSLTPGKEADLIVLRGDSLALSPVRKPADSVVYVLTRAWPRMRWSRSRGGSVTDSSWTSIAPGCCGSLTRLAITCSRRSARDRSAANWMPRA